jgi:hypothetical protein
MRAQAFRRGVPFLALGMLGACGFDAIASGDRRPSDAGFEEARAPSPPALPDGGREEDATVQRDAATDAPLDTSDAGCAAVIATDFTSGSLPAFVTESKDVTGSSITYDMTGVSGTRAMRVRVPVTGTHAGLVIHVQGLGADGARACAIACGFDVKVLLAGAAAIELTMEGPASLATISHSSTFTYFSRSGMGLEAPDLGTLGPSAFKHVELDIDATMGKATLGEVTNTKTLSLSPVSARVGLEKTLGDPEVEAIIDNVSCRSRLR